MLSEQDNDIMCRVGPGTPMGNLMREFWIPALMSSELPAPDSPPLRLRLLGENLMSFRDSKGRVGIFQQACPHRGASLFFGRNEEEGLRCVYHGWKFDSSGACVDMPSEPAESNFKSKVRVRAYPARERGEVVWVYMGPRESDRLPPLPDIETNMSPAGVNSANKILRECNFVQALEGDIDTSHISFLHRNLQEDAFAATPDEFNKYVGGDSAPRYQVDETEYGTIYGAYRPAEEDSYLLPHRAVRASVLHDAGHRPPWLRRPPGLPRVGACRRRSHDVLHHRRPADLQHVRQPPAGESSCGYRR